MKNTIVIDLDGICCDTTARQHLLDESWDAYQGALLSDTPIETTRAVLQGLSDANYEILVVTGRPARFDRQTIDWLTKNGFPVDEVLMRPDTDYRSESEVKIALLTDYFGSLEEARANVLVGFEVKDKVIEEMRNAGFEVWSLR